MLRFRQ